MKPLEALEILKEADTIYCCCASNLFARYRYEIETVEKSLKALEIIKEKPYLLLFTDFNLTYEEFVEQADEDYGYDLPTQEEFDLLKDTICGENKND